MKAISKINNTLAKIEGAVMVFWFAIVLVVMTCQVVSRYIFNAPIAWSEEFARYSFVWISYIGCAYCVAADTGITAFRDALPPKAKKLTTVLGNVVVMIVFIRLLPIAMKFIGKNSKFLTSMMRIPFKYLYYSLPVGCVLTVVHLILKSILLFAPDTIEKA